VFDNIPEPDWKVFVPLREVALNRLYAEILRELSGIIADDRPIRDRYMDVYKRLRERDKEIDQIFDGFSRSKAMLQLLMLRGYDLITDEELQAFSQPNRDTIQSARRFAQR
jgi:cell fate (sporulation/competence/biofilm development) regulator YlbF (YheA/YmcA/DUF963 family)